MGATYYVFSLLLKCTYLDQCLCIMYNLDNPFDILRIYVYLTYYDVLHCIYSL